MADGLLRFGAVPVIVASGVVLRKYMVDCEHGDTQLILYRAPDRDAQTLAGLVMDHRKGILVKEDQVCVCEPELVEQEEL